MEMYIVYRHYRGKIGLEPLLMIGGNEITITGYPPSYSPQLPEAKRKVMCGSYILQAPRLPIRFSSFGLHAQRGWPRILARNPGLEDSSVTLGPQESLEECSWLLLDLFTTM